jgi:HEPN domain-containing protein
LLGIDLHTHDLIALYTLVKSFADLGDKADLLQEIPQYYTTARYLSAGVRKPSTSFSKVQTLRAVGVATCVVERVMEAITRGCGELCEAGQGP